MYFYAFYYNFDQENRKRELATLLSKKRSPTFGTAAGEHNVSKKLSAKWEKVFLIGSHFIFFLTKMIIFFSSTTVVNHPSYIVRGPSQQVKPVVKPPKPPPKIQQLHYCDVCKISCAGRSNFPLEICI